MSTDSTGVVSWKVTRITMINAVRDAHPAPAGRLRRQKRLTHAELADAILLNLAPEAEPASLKAAESAERIIAARDAEIAGLKDDHYALIRAKDEQLGEAKDEVLALQQALTETELARDGSREAVRLLTAAGEDLRERAERAEAGVSRIATSLRPLAKVKGPTIAERTRVVAQILDSLDLPAADPAVAP